MARGMVVPDGRGDRAAGWNTVACIYGNGSDQHDRAEAEACRRVAAELMQRDRHKAAPPDSPWIDEQCVEHTPSEPPPQKQVDR